VSRIKALTDIPSLIFSALGEPTLIEGQKRNKAMDYQDEKYAKGAAGYDQRIRNTFPFYESIHPAMNAMLRGLVRPDSELLVVGAGTGAEIIELGKTNPDWRFMGVDPAETMLDVAKEKIEAAGLTKRASFFKGYVDELPADTFYDAATLGMVLHFVADDGGKLKVLRAIASHLKPGSSLILMDVYGDLTTPDSQLLLQAWRHQQNLAGLTWEQVENGMKERMQGIHFVSGNRIEQLLAEAGFHRVQRFFQVFMLGGWIAFKT
jgi:tRNA (cmo5U34)-methyltransferase